MHCIASATAAQCLGAFAEVAQSASAARQSDCCSTVLLLYLIFNFNLNINLGLSSQELSLALRKKSICTFKSGENRIFYIFRLAY